MLNKQGDEADAASSSTSGEGRPVSTSPPSSGRVGLGLGLTPAKVATALRYLAKRVGDAEKGTEEAAKDRGACLLLALLSV